MAYRYKRRKICVVCGDFYPPKKNAKTCSPECSATLRARTQKAHRLLNAARIAERLKRWREENSQVEAEKARVRRLANLEAYRQRGRDYQRAKRNTDPANYAENRDPEAIEQRKRERWRRGQAARRARLKERQP